MSKKLIFLADDDSEDRFIISMAFKEAGNKEDVQYFEDGEKLLEALHTIPGEHLPGLIILDLNMPRLSGTETLRLIKASPRLQHIAVIIFSTSVNEKEKAECISMGATDYVTKPSKYDESLEIVKYFYSLLNPVPEG